MLCSAVEHPLPNDSADLIATDPPYYNAIPYADLMDFFYVWLRRCIGDLFPDMFWRRADTKSSTQEICRDVRLGPDSIFAKGQGFLQKEMTHALRRSQQIVFEDGIGVIVFAQQINGRVGRRSLSGLRARCGMGYYSFLAD